jgi:hypothetical protein
MDVPVELSRILITELGDQQVIFLKEKNGERSFPILIGIAEALAIDRRLKAVETPRPFTHELLANVIRAMGGQIEKIVINDLREHTFFATLHIRRDGEVIEVDSRPSDAIALGVAFDTPIFVAQHVLEEVMGGTATKAQRIELLRNRMEMLKERIAELSERLEDENFLAQAPEDLVKGARRQLREMKQEYSVIHKVVKKLG